MNYYSVYKKSIFAFVISFSIFGMFYSVIDDGHKSHVHNVVKRILELQSKSFENFLQYQILNLDRMAMSVKDSNDSTYDLWKESAEFNLKYFSFLQAIEWADKESKVRWILPAKGNEAAINLKLDLEENRRNAIQESLKTCVGTFTQLINLKQGGKGMLSIHPTYDSSGNHFGYIVGVIRLNYFLDKLLNKEFLYQISVDGVQLWYNEFEVENISHEDDFHLGGKDFKILISPSSRYVKETAGYTGIFFFLAVAFLLFTINVMYLFRLRNAHKLKIKQLECDEVAKELNLILDKLDIGVFKLKLKSDDLFCNDNLYDLFDIEDRESLHNYESWKRILPSEFRIAADTEIKRLVEGKISELDFHFEIKTKSNNKKFLHARGILEINSTGNPCCVMGVVIDETKEYLMKSQLEHERIQSIHISKLAVVGEMAAGIAHEINNPLSVINMSCLAFQKLNKDEESLEIIEEVKNALDRCVKIIGGLKKFTRMHSESIRNFVSLKSIVQEVSTMTMVNQKKYDIECQIENLPNVELYCDEVNIMQVLVNLVNNAIYEVKDMESAWVKIQCEVNDEKIKISVVDSGTGISDSIVEKLFIPFFTTKPVGAGTGLGLSVAKGIMNDHQGDLLYSLKDGNTCFTAILPFVDKKGL